MTPALGFFGWIIIGGLAGWVASKLNKRDASMGILANILTGVAGGFIGGWILTLFGFDVESGGFIFSFLTCLLGAGILLWLLNFIAAKRQ